MSYTIDEHLLKSNFANFVDSYHFRNDKNKKLKTIELFGLEGIERVRINYTIKDYESFGCNATHFIHVNQRDNNIDERLCSELWLAIDEFVSLNKRLIQENLREPLK